MSVFLTSALLGVILSIVLCYAASQLNPDKTLGGAYMVLAVMLSPFVAVICGLIGMYLFSK